jgi:hypothetical protein
MYLLRIHKKEGLSFNLTVYVLVGGRPFVAFCHCLIPKIVQINSACEAEHDGNAEPIDGSVSFHLIM